MEAFPLSYILLAWHDHSIRLGMLHLGRWFHCCQHAVGQGCSFQPHRLWCHRNGWWLPRCLDCQPLHQEAPTSQDRQHLEVLQVVPGINFLRTNQNKKILSHDLYISPQGYTSWGYFLFRKNHEMVCRSSISCSLFILEVSLPSLCYICTNVWANSSSTIIQFAVPLQKNQKPVLTN